MVKTLLVKETKSTMQRSSNLGFARTSLAVGAMMLMGMAAPNTAWSQAHYTPGLEGIQGASLPPPGVYGLLYGVNYNINSFRAPETSDRLPGRNKGTVFALAGRMVWVTNQKVLGADYGMEAIVPFQRTALTVEAAGASDTRSGFGDIFLGPVILGWHGARWDALAALGWWLDTGSTGKLASPGKGYKSLMLTGGGTYYFDDARTLSVSGLMRWERHGRDKYDIRQGDSTTLEWGIGKKVGPVQLGLVGYDQWQTSSDKGPGVIQGSKFSKHAIGAEVIYPLSQKTILKGAFYQEWKVNAGRTPATKGNLFRIGLVKAF